MSELISRKNEHINLAVMGQENNKVDLRNTTYEPMMTAHNHSQSLEVRVAGKKLSAPLWISSMTGGTSDGMNLNAILANTLFPYTSLFRSIGRASCRERV